MSDYADYVPDFDVSWVGVLLDAAFGGSPPATLGPLLDRRTIAEQSDDAGLQIFVRTGASAPVGVRLETAWEPAAKAAAAVGTLPPDAPPPMFVDEREGQPLRVVAATLSPVEGATTPGGRPSIGVGLLGDQAVSFGVVGPDPVAVIGAGAHAALAAIAEHTPGMPWMACEAADGTVLSVVAANDAIPPRAAKALFAALGDVGGWDALRPAYTGRNLWPRAYWFEVWPDGTVEIAVHGVVAATRLHDEQAWAGLGGDDLDTAVRAAIIDALPQTDLVEGNRVLDEELMPVLARVWPGGDLADSALLTMLPTPAPDADAHLRRAGAHVLHQLTYAPPEERLATLKALVPAVASQALLREGYALAAARFHHKTAGAPVPPQVPASVLALTEAEIAAKAEALLPEADAMLAACQADPLSVERGIPGEPKEPEMAPEMLRRAIDGLFVGAPGPLFDYLDQAGRGAFDDDPSKVSLEDVDLDPGEADRAKAQIEAALLEDELADDQG